MITLNMPQAPEGLVRFASLTDTRRFRIFTGVGPLGWDSAENAIGNGCLFTRPTSTCKLKMPQATKESVQAD